MSYVHNVYFAFRPDASDRDFEAQIADANELRAKIPTVRLVLSGRRDATVQRDVSLTDFDLGLTVHFDNRAGLDTYSDHPLHLEFVNRHKGNWSSVRVCDFDAGPCPSS